MRSRPVLPTLERIETSLELLDLLKQLAEPQAIQMHALYDGAGQSRGPIHRRAWLEIGEYPSLGIYEQPIAHRDMVSDTDLPPHAHLGADVYAT